MSATKSVYPIASGLPLHKCEIDEHYYGSLYPRNVWKCPRDCGYFRTRVLNGAYNWQCPTCYAQGEYAGKQCCYCDYVEEPPEWFLEMKRQDAIRFARS